MSWRRQPQNGLMDRDGWNERRNQSTNQQTNKVRVDLVQFVPEERQGLQRARSLGKALAAPACSRPGRYAEYCHYYSSSQYSAGRRVGTPPRPVPLPLRSRPRALARPLACRCAPRRPLCPGRTSCVRARAVLPSRPRPPILLPLPRPSQLPPPLPRRLRPRPPKPANQPTNQATNQPTDGAK